LPEHTLNKLTQAAYLGLLQQCNTDADKKCIWQKIPAEWRIDADILVTYLPVLIHDNDMITAEGLIRHSLKKTWDTRLVEFYGLVHLPDLDRQIKGAEAWQKPYPEDPAVLLCLARLYAAKDVWGHARELLEMSLSIKPSPQTHLALAQVYESLGEKEKAALHYAQGLKMCVVI
jgi:HemY protein